MDRRLLLVAALSSAPSLVRAAPWTSSCNGLSEEAFIIIVVESVIILLLLLTILVMAISARRRRRRMRATSNTTPLRERTRDSRHKEPLDADKGRPSLDSGDEEDIEQSAPFLPLPSTIFPDTLRPRSMSLSTRDSIHSPALLMPGTLRTSRHIASQASEGSRSSRFGEPRLESFSQPHGLPNPYSEIGHGESLEEPPPESPTAENITSHGSVSVYSQPSQRTIPPLKPGAGLWMTEPDVPSSPTDLSRNTTAWSTVPSNPAVHTAAQPRAFHIEGAGDERPASVPAAVIMRDLQGGA